MAPHFALKTRTHRADEEGGTADGKGENAVSAFTEAIHEFVTNNEDKKLFNEAGDTKDGFMDKMVEKGDLKAGNVTPHDPADFNILKDSLKTQFKELETTTSISQIKDKQKATDSNLGALNDYKKHLN